MMYGTGYSWGWMWVGGVLMLLILVALIVLIVRLSVSDGASRPRETYVADPARRIAEERLARGEIAPDEFHRILGALNEHR